MPMEDQKIIELYFRRDEAAIRETEAAYGPLCLRIAMNILSIREDAEECVSDTWHQAWNRIPPTKPLSLRAFLGRITRDLSISRWRQNHAKCRYDGMEILLSELDECVPAPSATEKAAELRDLTEHLAAWLRGLSREDRVLFLRRYWYGDSIEAIANRMGFTKSKVKTALHRIRGGLRTFLEEKGVSP